MKPEKVDYAAWIGVDWGSDQHAVCLRASDGGPLESYSLQQKPESLHAWIVSLRIRFGGRTVALAIEQSKGAVTMAAQLLGMSRATFWRKRKLYGV